MAVATLKEKMELASEDLTTAVVAAIVRNSPEPVVALTADLTVCEANDAFYESFHVSREGSTGRSIYDLSNGRWNIPRLRFLLEEIRVRERLSSNFELTHAFEGTETRTIALHASWLKSEGMTYPYILLRITDITARIQTELALRESEERYRALFDLSPVAVFVCNTDAILRTYNRRAAELWGREPVCGVEKHCGSVKLWLPNGAPLPHGESPVVEVLRTGTPALNVEVSIERPDGSRLPVLACFAALKDAQGRITGAISSFVDIRERRKLEDATRESERRLRLVMDSMPQKAFTATPGGEVDYVNPQLLEFTGLSFHQIREWGWTQFMHPDEVDENVRVWRHSVKTGEPFNFEHRFRRADGEYRWHLSRAVPIRDDEGAILMWVGSNTEVHEQMQSASLLRQNAFELAEAGRRKNEFLAMLAHELRNPLAPMRNAIQIMREAGGAGQSFQMAFAMMERQVGQMVRLVDDLLDVSRISRGKVQLRLARIDLSSAVNQAVEATLPLCTGKAQELIVALPPEPIVLNADPARLTQVVGNLLHNASKFTDTGGRIWLTVEVKDSSAAIRVRDSGIGIAGDQLHRIFDLFAQVDTSLERSTGGLGIGLTLVRTLVELHGGTVTVHSSGPGNGSEFIVQLPIPGESQKPATGPPEPDPGASERGTTKVHRILVVDDNRDSATSLAALLKIAGHQTQTAFDGLEALRVAVAFLPDVVLLDIALPGLNGFEAARQLREQPWGDSIVLVAMTGFGQEEDRGRSRRAGFNAHVVKPIAFADLLKLLSELRPDSEPARG